MSSNLEQLLDESLMKLYQEGDELAFELLYKRHSARVYGFIMKKVGNTSLSSELLQETFFRLHHSRSKYNIYYPFLPWIFTIAKNIIIDNFRKSQKSIQTFAINEEISNREEVITDEQDDHLEQILEGLPETQRIAIKNRYLQNWSFEQIALELATSPSNSRKLVSRGILSLKNSFCKKGESK